MLSLDSDLENGSVFHLIVESPLTFIFMGDIAKWGFTVHGFVLWLDQVLRRKHDVNTLCLALCGSWVNKISLQKETHGED